MANSTDGSIRYSDLIIPDDAVNNLIAQLEKLGQTYDNLVKDIQAQSRQMEQALGKASAATQQGQESIRRMAQEAERLYEQSKQAQQVSSAVQEEIRTVKELEQAINREIGTREQNSRMMAEQQRVITQLRAQLAAYQKDLNKGAQLTAEQTAQYNKLNAEISEHTNLRNKARTALSQETKEMQAAEGSIRQLQAQVARLSNTYANMGAEMREGAEGQALLKTLQQQYAELSKLEQAMGVYRRNVGNYASAWNGLGVSVQQVVRELPSLSMGFDMFFLAISNNLPMLTDEIKAATEAYKQAVAQGQKATPVWKQVLSSIVSWQTALIVGITLLAQYGDDIINWVKGLFTAKEALDVAAEAQKMVNDAMMQGAKDAQREKVQLDLLYKSATDVTKPMEDRRKAVDELQRIYPDYLGNMRDEDILAGNAASAYTALSKELLRAARAKAAMNKITENQEKLLELEPQLANAQAERERTQQELDAINQRARQYTDSRDAISTNAQVLQSYAQQSMNAAQALSAAQEAEQELQTQIDTLNAANEELAKMVATDDVIAATGGAGKGRTGRQGKTGKPYDPYQDDLDARRAYQDALGRLISDEYDRRRYQTTLQYNREIEDIQHRLDTEKNLTEDAQKNLTAQMVLIAEQRNDALEQIEKEHQIQLLELEKQGIEARMQGLNEETDQYRTLQNKLFSVNNRLALARNEALPAGERQDPQQITAASNREAAAYNYQFELDKFDEYLEEAYDKDYKSEKAKTAMRLQMEKERWEKIMQLTEKYGSDVTGYQVGQIKESIGKIDGELSKLGKGWDPEQGVFGNLFDMVLGNPFGSDAKGLDKEQAFKDSISTSVSYAMDALQQFADYKAELADRAVESAEKEVDAAQSVLDAELQARANGYANNVQQAQKELALAKKNQRQALLQQQQAQRQQQAIQSLEQIGNMVTATSLIWSQLGFPAAIPATAIMWASFAASKIKAAQLAKQSIADMGTATEKYGEGTVELLQGGSHQSGNDIDLGRKPDGTRRRAEGGEFFAVINKRSSRRFRSVIPDVINSLNDGSFAHKYLNAYKGAAELDVELHRGTAQSPDLSALSGDVRAIRRQGDRRTYTDGRGRTVIEYGLHRRRIINNN